MLSQFTEAFYCNPDCETQCEDLPHNGKYPTDWIQEYNISCSANRALIGAGENVFLWYSAMSPMHFLSTIKRTPRNMYRCHYGCHSVENVVGQEGNNEKYQNFSRSLMHGMQPSDDDDLQDVSVMSISLRSHKCQAHRTALQTPKYTSNYIPRTKYRLRNSSQWSASSSTLQTDSHLWQYSVVVISERSW